MGKDIDSMTSEELTQALQNEMEVADQEGMNSEQEGELEENTQGAQGAQEAISDDSESETESEPQGEETEEKATEPEASKPKESKGVKKLLSERNELRKRIQELESQAGSSRETDIEYINKVAEKVALDIISEREFFSTNPAAQEAKDEIKSIANEHNLDLDRAYKLYLLDNDPDELRIQENKKSAKKLSAPSYSSSKLKATPNPKEMTSDDLAKELRGMLQSGSFRIY